MPCKGYMTYHIQLLKNLINEDDGYERGENLFREAAKIANQETA